MQDMFYFQCQQAAQAVSMSECAASSRRRPSCRMIWFIKLIAIDGPFTTLTNVNLDNESLQKFIEHIIAEEENLDGYDEDLIELWKEDTDTVSLCHMLLFGLKGMATYAPQHEFGL